MDAVLAKAWKASARPFDGETLNCSDLLPLSALRNLMIQVVNELKGRFAHEPLQRFDDWHQHDGFISPAESSGWEDLDQILSSEKSLYENRAPDDFVRRAFYDKGKTFLFRFHIADEDDDLPQYPGIWGDFDLTASIRLIKQISLRLGGEGKDQL